jgi:hypothetical protein
MKTCTTGHINMAPVAKRAIHVLGPVPGVGVMAKRSQGLLNAGALSCGLLAVSGAICGGASAGGGFFHLQGGALGGPGPVWAQLGPRPPHEGLFGCN